ncbi:MAG: class I SAM-dependent methyltransferase [Chloroflexota bacterium]|nr:class I SAM-dependent methyltransferase [Chloroflexota bacterium]
MTAEATAAARWADQVRANRDQVDRVREVPDGQDFYSRVTSLFRADPRRTGEPVLDLLRGLARPDDTWLDIGAGAGRYALPLALTVREVIAVDPSKSMLGVLRDLMAEHDIANIRIVEGRWPLEDEQAARLGTFPLADVSLIAHVGYDIEAIEPFIAAMEAATGRLCVAVLMERTPASAAEPFWPPVHGELRIPLPALPQFVELLRERRRQPSVIAADREQRRFESRDELVGFLRRQLWIADGGEKERRFNAEVERLVVEDDDGVSLAGAPLAIGVVTWTPR